MMLTEVVSIKLSLEANITNAVDRLMISDLRHKMGNIDVRSSEGKGQNG
jgi:hypothetical protein